ncbi:MAG: hypothetical protein NTW80_05680, partial [Deltaproteobacteria bacterium]|nr:hypothetical protein [Deltaproteobacteria bacterium]
ATKKFIDFVLEFLPPPPIKRPAQWSQIDWSKNKIKKALRKIYSYRSKALHGGIPFPAPMCLPPFRQPKWEAYSEKPLGPDVRKLGGKWLEVCSPDDIPMLLQTFEYITRGVLLEWWETISSQ